MPQPRTECDQLGVHVRARTPHRLHVHLPELAVAAGLRGLVPEHGTQTPELVALAAQHAVGDQRAHDAGGGLGPQRQAVPAAVDEGVHLLADHVGMLADRSLEELGVLDHRNADLLVAVGTEQLARAVLEVLPGTDLRGQHIVHPAHRLNLSGHLSPRAPGARARP